MQACHFGSLRFDDKMSERLRCCTLASAAAYGGRAPPFGFFMSREGRPSFLFSSRRLSSSRARRQQMTRRVRWLRNIAVPRSATISRPGRIANAARRCYQNARRYAWLI